MEDGKNPNQLNIIASPLIKKTGYSKWPICRWREDEYCNGGNFLGAYIVGNTLHYQDFEWYEIANHDQESEHENQYKNEERYELFNDATRELPVCTIRRLEMIKYSFRQAKEYVAIKEDKYEDLKFTSKDACHAYQETFLMMDEGRTITRDE
nr:hypothetical protein [Tanacetum cinerariifolium]